MNDYYIFEPELSMTIGSVVKFDEIDMKELRQIHDDVMKRREALRNEIKEKSPNDAGMLTFVINALTEKRDKLIINRFKETK